MLTPETKGARICRSSWLFACWIPTYIRVALANPDLVHPCISNKIGVLLLVVFV